MDVDPFNCLAFYRCCVEPSPYDMGWMGTVLQSTPEFTNFKKQKRTAGDVRRFNMIYHLILFHIEMNEHFFHLW